MPETAWEVFVRRHPVGQAFYAPGEPVTDRDRRSFFRGRHELSFVVFTAAGRPLQPQSSCRDGAVDADAGGKALSGAAAAEGGRLRAARTTGRPDHCRSLAC